MELGTTRPKWDSPLLLQGMASVPAPPGDSKRGRGQLSLVVLGRGCAEPPAGPRCPSPHPLSPGHPQAPVATAQLLPGSRVAVRLPSRLQPREHSRPVILCDQLVAFLSGLGALCPPRPVGCHPWEPRPQVSHWLLSARPTARGGEALFAAVSREPRRPWVEAHE